MNFKENESATKLRGGYYTAPEIARYLLRWVSVVRPKVLLEPSCGDGVFFRQMPGIHGLENTSALAFELEPSEAEKSRLSGSALGDRLEVRNRDFLEWALTNVMRHTADAAVGNPPFIRYQYLDKTLQERSEALFAHFRLPFTKHTNAWVPFVIGCVATLRPGGRIAMVVPAEILHVLHAQSLRTYLGQNCSRVLVIDPEELLFDDALQGAVLLLAEKKHAVTDHSHGVAVVRTFSRAFLSEDPEQLFRSADYANGPTTAGKWMRALLSHRQRDLLSDSQTRPKVFAFNDVADADVGIVTGANKFFLVPDATVADNDLSDWAHPMFGRSDHVRGVIYDKSEHQRNRREGNSTNFLWFKAGDEHRLNAKALSYIKEGEREKLHTRYKCRIRSPWYAVPSVYSTPVGMLKRSHDFPRLIHNSLGAFTTDTAYRIAPKQNITPHTLVFSFLNSLTALTAELEGRHYGGGVLELVPSEIAKLLIPIRESSAADLRELDKDVRNRISGEDVLIKQDERVLSACGFTPGERTELLEAWATLKRRRHRESDAQDQDTSSVNGEPAEAGA